METISSSSITINNLLLPANYDDTILSDVISKRTLLKKLHSKILPEKRKGKILIQDKVEMVRCNGICGKYNRS